MVTPIKSNFQIDPFVERNDIEETPATLTSGIFFPDNSKREDRLKNLAAYIQQDLLQLQHQSEKFEKISDHINKKMEDCKKSIETITSMIPEKNKDLINKLKEIVSQIDGIKSNTAIHVDNKTNVRVLKFAIEIAAAVWGRTVIGKSATRYIENMLFQQFLEAHIAENEMQAAFIFTTPKWVRFTGGGIGLGGLGIGVAIKLALSGITGSIQKNNLQDLTKETLDARYEAKAAQMASEYTIESMETIYTAVSVFGNIIEKTGEKCKEGKYDEARTFIDLLGINGIVSECKEKIEKITVQKVLDALAKADKDQWRDLEVESVWTPPKPESTPELTLALKC
jgi:hypothetical protein